MKKLVGPQIDITFENDWLIKNNSYNKDTEHIIETLFALGNGYLVSRAIVDEAATNKINYSGNYITGLYNKALHVIGDRKIERDEIVNLPNWWHINFKIANNSWFDINRDTIVNFERSLDFRNGVLKKNMIVKDKVGHLTKIESERVISFENPHFIAQKYTVEPLNYDALYKIENKLNGNVYNERDIKAKHLYISEKEGTNKNLYMVAETLKSNKSILIMNHMEVFIDDEKQDVFFHFYDKEREVTGEFEIEVKQNRKLKIEKTGHIKQYELLLNTKSAISETREILKRNKSYIDIKNESQQIWNEVWENVEVRIDSEEQIQPFINFYIYHLLITFSHNTEKGVSGFPSFSLHAERNNGLAGWEELFILPFYNLHFPDISKKILEYRFKRLDNAIKNASSFNIKGALFPWKSGIEGTEQSYREKLDPKTGEWLADMGYLQRHINISVAYNIIHHFKSTNDIDFLIQKGLPLLIEICRFWADTVVFDRKKNRYEVKGVVGPDEYHTKLGSSYTYGIDNNAYTNIMLIWLLKNTVEIIVHNLKENKDGILQNYSLKKEELKKWSDISMFMKIDISDDEIIEQFSGFFELKEVDWMTYRKKFPKLHNIDRILTVEGKSVNDYQICNQADTLLPFYFLTPAEFREILLDSGYLFDPSFLDANFEYYFKRTVHSSLISNVIHSLIAKHVNNDELCYDMFIKSLKEVFHNEYEETTSHGINMGVAGALLNVVYMAFAGIQFKEDHLVVNSKLPPSWNKLEFIINYRGNKLKFEISKSHTLIKCIKQGKNILIADYNQKEIPLNENVEIELK